MTEQILVVGKNYEHIFQLVNVFFGALTQPKDSMMHRISPGGNAEYHLHACGSALTGAQYDTIIVFGFQQMLIDYGDKAFEYILDLKTHLKPGGNTIFM